jgi:glycerophosphoryl diester phosphodiesterase
MGKPFLCIGHRGAMGHEPENTLRSIRKALELGAPCVEIDVYWVDGHLMVIHDDRLERTTNGSGLVMEQTFDHLRSLDAGKGERIPTLEEVCNLVEGKAGLNIELKGPGTAAPVANFIGGRNKDAFLVSSFDHRELLNLRQLDAEIRLGILTQTALANELDFAASLDAFSINPYFKPLLPRFVDDAHTCGIKVYPYTVNEPEDLARMTAMGVDGIFTNYPERVLEHYAQGDVPPFWAGR